MSSPSTKKGVWSRAVRSPSTECQQSGVNNKKTDRSGLSSSTLNAEPALVSWRKTYIATNASTLPTPRPKKNWVASKPTEANRNARAQKSVLDEGLSQLSEFLDDMLRHRTETMIKSTHGYQPPAGTAFNPEKTVIAKSNTTMLAQRLKEAETARLNAEEKLAKALSEKLEETKKRMALEQEKVKQTQELRQKEHLIELLRTKESKDDDSLFAINEISTAPEDVRKHNELISEIAELRATLDQLVDHIQARENDLQIAMNAIQELEQTNQDLQQQLENASSFDTTSFVPTIGEEKVKEQMQMECEAWKAKFIAEYERKMNIEKEEYARKLREQFNEKKETDMVKYLLEQEEKRKAYEENFKLAHPQKKLELVDSKLITRDDSNAIRCRFPTVSAITEDLIMSGRTEHDVDELLAGVVASVRAITIHFSKAKNIHEKLAFGNDSTCAALPGLTRGGLSTSLVKVFLHRFKRERTATGKHHVWDAVVAATQEISTATEFALFCESVNTCQSYTTDKHKAFRCFVCLGLNQHLLHVWMYIIAASSHVCAVYYSPGALLTEPEPLAILVNALRPLSHGALPFKLALNFEEKK